MTSKLAYLQVKFAEAVWHDEPYDGNPRDFYDRVSDKEKALDILLSPQTRRAIWLVGERRAGKTSMLKLLLNKCRAQEGYIVIEIPWQFIHSPESFYRECLQQLDKHANEGCLPLPKIYTPESFWESLQSRIQRVPAKTIVVGIDELDTILYQLAQNNNNWPREIVSVVFRFVEEAGFKIIVTTTKTPEEVEPLKASPLVSRSEVIRLCPFDNEDIKSLVEDFFPGCPEPYLEQILHLSGNWPYYAKALLFHYLQQTDYGDVRRLELAQKEAVRSIAPTCEHVYRRHLDEEEQRALLLLARKGSLCQEEFNRLDIRLRTAFRRLIERGYVLEEKQRFYFRVQLIGNWFQTWVHRELEEERLGIPQLVKRLERDSDPWREEPGEISIRVTKEEMRRRGF